MGKEAEGEAFLVWEFLRREEARAAAYMEAPLPGPIEGPGAEPAGPVAALRSTATLDAQRVRPFSEIQTASGCMSAGQWSQCDFPGAEIAYDVWYVDSISFSLDAKTSWLTILKVLGRADITPPGMKSMPAFRGRSDDK